MIKKNVFFLLFILSVAVIFSGCDQLNLDSLDTEIENQEEQFQEDEESQEGVLEDETQNEVQDEEETIDDETEFLEEQQEIVEEEQQACVTHTDCSDENKCIDNICGTFDQFYSKTDCENTCEFRHVTLVTNNNERHEDFVSGKGSYIAAGAIEWKIEKTPNHCEGETAIIPIEIVKRNYGEVISEEYVTISKGSTSNTITHPTITSVAFTLHAEDVTLECSN